MFIYIVLDVPTLQDIKPSYYLHSQFFTRFDALFVFSSRSTSVLDFSGLDGSNIIVS